jgi:hypothetical protein
MVMTLHPRHILFLVPLLLGTVACAPGGVDGPFEVYLDRLARSLGDTPDRPLLPTPVTRPPRTGALRIALPTGNLDALDFLDLRGCDLQVTVGKANSSLGRMARDSQRLLLDLEYLRLAPACVERLRGEGEQGLADQLQSEWERKRTQLPARIFNATLANSEFRDLWKPTALAGYPTSAGSTPITALESINTLATRWLAGDYRADNEAFELLLYDVSLGDAGTLWRALGHQGAWLDQADRLVNARLERGPLCTPNRRPEAADIVPNVVRKFFIAGIQPRAAELGQRYHALLPPVQALEQQLDAVLPGDYRSWRDERDAALSHMADGPRRHAQRIQALLDSCGGFQPSR